MSSDTPRTAPRIGAVMLAAGMSTRLGEAKPLADLGGASLLDRVARLFHAAGVAEVVVVAGHRADAVRAEAARLGLRCVVNADYAAGMYGSVTTGLAALPPGLDAFFVLPVDIPLVRPHTLRALLGRFARTGAAVLHPVFDGRRGHPPLVAAAHLGFLAAWAGEGGLGGALAGLEAAHGVEDVAVADRNIHFDVDTPADLAEARRRWSRRGIPTPGEALALLRAESAGERGLAHARAVADAALALARALNARGAALDLELLESAALLHDIAKGAKGHEQAGAALLESLGFGPAARIVAAHRDIAPDSAPEITERELVYFADKLCRGDSRVSVEARFGQKLEHFKEDAEACAAIRRRLANALDMRRRIEAAAGRELAEILGEKEAA